MAARWPPFMTGLGGRYIHCPGAGRSIRSPVNGRKARTERMNDRLKERKCRLCGEVPQIAPLPTAITVSIETVDGEVIPPPHVVPLCLRCRQQVAHAEQQARNNPGAGL